MKYLLQRLAEPSTWSGLAVIAVSLGLGAPAGLIEAVGQIGAGVAGALSIVLRERGKL